MRATATIPGPPPFVRIRLSFFHADWPVKGIKWILHDRRRRTDLPQDMPPVFQIVIPARQDIALSVVPDRCPGITEQRRAAGRIDECPSVYSTASVFVFYDQCLHRTASVRFCLRSPHPDPADPGVVKDTDTGLQEPLLKQQRQLARRKPRFIAVLVPSVCKRRIQRSRVLSPAVRNIFLRVM